MTKTDLLNEAKKNIYSFSSGDASDVISRLNLGYGVGKIIYALQKRKMPYERTMCISAPDSGITRNKERWQAGFGYGCLIRWPGEQETGKLIMFPQVKPNACGMLVAKISKSYEPKELCDRLHHLEKNGFSKDSEAAKLNLGVSNHFIELCRVTKSKDNRLTQNDLVVVIHTSASEKKSILYDFNNWQNKGGKWEQTPLGPLLVLEDQAAKQYLEEYNKIEQYSIKKRKAIAEHLFGDASEICNPTHQGLTADNEVRLGSYRVDDGKCLFPVTFRWDLQIHLVSALPNLSDDVIKQKGYYGTAKQRGILDLFKTANILPHGGGYQIPFSATGWNIIENGSKRLFSNKDLDNHFVFTSPSELPYNYRGLQVMDKIDKLKLGKSVVSLKQLYTLKY
ncbi:MAG: hypothetical protein C4562_00525 [Actinobacteria bacterium]|nr:MAG: hypothetical protein C4562_00525 [Actinomycetota bacterium]